MRLSKNKKIIYSVLAFVLILFIAYKGTSLARFNNRGASFNDVWSGRTASSFRSGTGTVNDPYIISNGEELAYLSSSLQNDSYDGVYFKVLNDIVLNEGIFSYVNGSLYYDIDGSVYYVNGNKYYDQNTNDEVGSLRILDSLDGFEGIIDFNYHVLYGFYSNESLFTNLSGNVSSLYLENSVVSGNGDLSLFANTISDSTIKNIVVDGFILSNVFNDGGLTIDNISLLSNYANHQNTLIGGIAVYIEDATIINCINKSNVYGGYLSSGLIAYSENSSIVNSYSVGDLDSYLSTTIGVFKGSGLIDKVYNSGVINSSLIGFVINGDLEISNSFIATNNKLLNDSSNSTITSTNNYYVQSGMGNNISSTLTTINNLKDKNFLTSYSEYISKSDLLTNPLNVWIFNEDSFPVLYFDDVINNTAELHINTFMWNSYSTILNERSITTNITLIISDVDNMHVSRKYYYVTDEVTPFTKSELEDLEWTEYSDILTVSNEGTYVFYVKTIDNNDMVRYINSDILVLDKTAPNISISIGNDNWSALTNDIVYKTSSFTVNVSSSDDISEVVSLEYYLANAELNDLNGVNWSSYTGSVNINNAGEYKLYVKATNSAGLTSYASTPLVVYDGYVVSNLKPVGFNNGNIITKNSSLIFDIAYSNNRSVSINHNLVTSTALPVNTKITLMDKTNNAVYEYVVTSSALNYSLSSFKKIGIDDNVYYSNNNVTNESYTIMLDFSNCEINSDLSNINVYLEGVNNGNVIRPTIVKSSFNIDSDDSGITYGISTDFNSNIRYNTTSTNTVNISSSVTMGEVYDTSYSDKKLGLIIKFVNSSGTTISKDHLKNISFKVGDVSYAPGSDNAIRINLNTNSSTNTSLKITTFEGATSLEPGTYYIKINGFVSNDGLYYKSGDLTSAIRIPVIVNAGTENTNNNYSFDVLIDSQNRIIEKGSIQNLSFNVLESGLTSPNIRVSLYRKKELTAFNQEYQIIDMQNYTATQLDRQSGSVYYVTRNAVSYATNSQYNAFNLALNTANLDKTGYKFVFDLYDGNIKVETIEKYFIIK